MATIAQVAALRDARLRRAPQGDGTLKQRPCSDSNQILLADDLAKPAVVGDEFLDELMHAVLEDIGHVAVLKTVANAAGMALRGALAAVGDADLIEVADQVAVTARQRARQRLVQYQEVGDQPRF